MKKSPLTYSELDILRVLWNAERSLSRPEILEQLPNKTWNSNSINLILNNMIEKGLLIVDGMTRCGRGYGRTYSPTMQQCDYVAKESLDLTSNIPAKKRIVKLFCALLEQEPITHETLDTLEQMLTNYRKKLENSQE